MGEKPQQMKFLTFQNEDNLCWLDASMILLAHNRTFKKVVECFSESQINKIISAYNEAIITLNNPDGVKERNLSKAQKILLEIQTSTLEYLKKFLKFKPGEPDSAFCALLNLIHQDKSNTKEIIKVSWNWRKQCSNCGLNSKSALCSKPIITLSKVKKFNPENPSSIYVCSCKSKQEMKLIYKNLPVCLIFHFEKGAGFGTKYPTTFCVKGRSYQLTSVIILEKSRDTRLNHFVSWIRNPSFNMWLDCNDLNTSSVSFSPIKPDFDLKDVYMYVFESFDSMDKICNEDLTDDEQDIGNVNVEIIDLSEEESDSEITASLCKTRASKVCKAVKNYNWKTVPGVSDPLEGNTNYLIDAPKEELYKSKRHCDSNQNNPVDYLRLTDENSLEKHTIDAKLRNSDFQDKALNTNETEVTDYSGPRVTDVSLENKKEIYLYPSNIGEQYVSVSNLTVTNTISQSEHTIFEKPKEMESQNGVDNARVISQGVAHYSKFEITSIGWNEKERMSSSFCSYSFSEGIVINNSVCAVSSSERKEEMNDKLVSSKNEKCSNLFDQTVTSATNEEIAESTLLTKRSPKSQNSEHYAKTPKMLDTKNVKTYEKGNSSNVKDEVSDELKHYGIASEKTDENDQSPNAQQENDELKNSCENDETDEKLNNPNGLSDIEIREMTEPVVESIFASFFQKIIQMKENNSKP